MKHKTSIFKDQQGRFSLKIPSTWKYKEKDIGDDENLYQFRASADTFFQISVKPINDHIAKVLSKKKILPHEAGLPGISYIEDFQISHPMEVYSWMASVEGNFVFAMYYFDIEKKERRELALELHDVRFALRNMIFHNPTKEEPKCNGLEAEGKEPDYSDIASWRDLPIKYYSFVSRKKKNKNIKKATPLEVDVVKLYALLSLKVSQQPNGFFDMLRVAKPLDNPIWWDFVMECEKGFIQVWRTAFILEAQYDFEGDFDLQTFFNNNFERYKSEIEERIKDFDQHTIYINHYQSYKGCVETLWEEIQQIDLRIPKMPSGHLIVDGESEEYRTEVETFSANSIRYHALAKSLVLNAAFKIESYLNLVIRVGSKPELHLYPEVLSRFLKLEFAQRVKNLRFYSQILIADIDMGSNIYRQTKELMTLRNKYVHYEEDAIHNKLGEIYYDRDYPLHKVEKNRPAIDAIIKTFHHPDINAVRNAYDVSSKFVAMVESLFNPELKSDLLFLMEQNPIGYNKTKGIYSAVYTPIALDFFTSI